MRRRRKPELSERVGGAGFGRPEQNKLVERAAVRYVRHYGVRVGQLVMSRPKTMDMILRDYRKEHHVEVRGARGEGQRFVLTAPRA